MTASPGSQASPLPYCGALDSRRDRIGTRYSLPRCATDLSERTRYDYNTLGYRGPEFDPSARLRIYAFGESDAFGVGVALEDAWPSRVAAIAGRALGLAEHEVCCLNFAEPGGSNALIARSVIGQCTAAPPHLVLINLAEPRRAEVLVEDESFNAGPWLDDPAERRRIRKTVHQHPRAAIYDEALDRAAGFLAFADDANAAQAALHELLLMQLFLKSRGIPAIATARPLYDPTSGSHCNHASTRPLIAAVDPDFYAAHAVRRYDHPPAADGTHLGEAAQHAIARTICQQLEARGVMTLLRSELH